MSIYFPTYSITEALSEGDRDWLNEQQGDGPLALSDVTDVCSRYAVSATLRNEQGFVVGHVSATGDYRLGA